MRLLVVTAVAAEADAVRRGIKESPDITVIAGGVGIANSAAATAEALAGARFDAVVCAGIGGGIGLPLGSLAIARACVAADLGAQSPDGYLSIDELGFGSSTVECSGPLAGALRQGLPDAAYGAILTINTVTGTAARTAELTHRHPDAVAEAMEGFGVATAALRVGLPVAEVRAISNAVGPRDRSAWKIPDALAALERVGVALASL